jgi:hypothetical protein
MIELADKLEALAKKHREPWYIEKEPHDYNDGTTHFTHVRYKTIDGESADVMVAVAEYVRPPPTRSCPSFSRVPRRAARAGRPGPRQRPSSL